MQPHARIDIPPSQPIAHEELTYTVINAGPCGLLCGGGYTLRHASRHGVWTEPARHDDGRPVNHEISAEFILE